MKRILKYFQAKRLQGDLASEMQAHLDEKIGELIADGIAPVEAHTRARARVGRRFLRLAETVSRLRVTGSLRELADEPDKRR